jgi:hypothetical protein
MKFPRQNLASDLIQLPPPLTGYFDCGSRDAAEKTQSKHGRSPDRNRLSDIFAAR